MSAPRTPWDQRMARVLVRPLVRARVHPNLVTALTALLALAGAALLASTQPQAVNWGAGLFVLSRFLDHFDGELARQSGRSSPLGYLLDYLAGGVSYAALFIGIAIGLYHGSLGAWVIALGALGSASAVLAVWLNMAIDRRHDTGAAVGYPALAGFELEDGIYMLAPLTWLGWLAPFFVAACVGAGVYLLYTAGVLLRTRSAHRLAP
jgi:phosphatidylglycerophosphate synthase